MNYASAFLALILLAAGLYWVAGGRKFYTGPLIEAQAEDESSFFAEGAVPGEGEREKRDVES